MSFSCFGLLSPEHSSKIFNDRFYVLDCFIDLFFGIVFTGCQPQAAFGFFVAQTDSLKYMADFLAAGRTGASG